MESTDTRARAVESAAITVADASGAGQANTRRGVYRWQEGRCRVGDDLLAVEEPLQIRMAGVDVAVTMRTPGHDAELALGFLFAEGLISGMEQVDTVGHCPAPDGSPSANVVNVQPSERELVDPRHWGRNFVSSSSCGLCGKTSIEQVKVRFSPAVSDVRISLEALYSLPSRLREAQATFADTGGLHAAGLFSLDGELIAAREDVGRHNAVDKITGYALLEGLLPLSRYILLVSSRASFEIMQKCAVAGMPIVAAVSAPSSLAVEVADEANITLVGFLRGNRANIYTRPERILTG